jgi:hypothetical protein
MWEYVCLLGKQYVKKMQRYTSIHLLITMLERGMIYGDLLDSIKHQNSIIYSLHYFIQGWSLFI